MGKLIVTEFVTLDGVAQAPGQPDEDRERRFEHGGWQAPLWDDEAGDSLDLVQSLLRFGLVDRLNLWQYPLLLGTGKRVFADGTVPAALRLIDSATYPGGVVHVVYEPAGTPTYGTM